ncbi:hypothetical protein KY363_00040 [Candidatus Woesearchaeota archaeon]|nr:hypothetical protein [Candidatus Woesearchaeota archaeon]
MTKEKQTSLETLLNSKYADHLAECMNEYMSATGQNESQAAKTLEYPRGTFIHWRAKKSSPLWKNYYELRLRIRAAVQPDDDAALGVDSLLTNLSDYFTRSIRLFCKDSEFHLSEFAELLGYHSTSLYQWANQDANLPRQKDLFRVLAVIYEGKAKADEIITPVIELNSLARRDYMSLLGRAFPKRAYEENAREPEQGISSSEEVKIIPLTGGDEQLDRIITELNSFQPSDPVQRARFYQAIITRLVPEVIHYRKASKEERDVLRHMVMNSRSQLLNMLIEARQVLREEDGYQGYLDMNKMK